MPVGWEQAGPRPSALPGSRRGERPRCPAGGCQAGEEPGAPPRLQLPPKMSGSRGHVGEEAGEKRELLPAPSSPPGSWLRWLWEGKPWKLFLLLARHLLKMAWYQETG